MPQTGPGFTTLDGIVLFTYFIGIVAYGLWIARRIRSTGGYFLGERKLPWWIMLGQVFGTGTHAEMPVVQAGAVYAGGFAAIWIQWKNLLITPFYWLFAPWFRRSERTTTGEIVEDRYGSALAFVYTVYAIALFVFNQGGMLKGAGKVIAVATGGNVVTANQVVIVMTAAFILYSFFGGLLASAYTDFVQAGMIIVLSFMLIPSGLSAVGGFSGMRAALPAESFHLWGEAAQMGAFYIAMLTLTGIVGIVALPHTLSMCATGATERAGRIGNTYGAVVKRFCTIGWALTGLIVAALLVQRGGTLADPEEAFGYAARELLYPGLTGLLAACVLAANMSTCSNFMVNTGALFTRNLYQRYLRRGAPDRELLWCGRFSGLILTGLGILFALYVENLKDAFLFTESLAALIGVMILSGFLWKRANRWGAWAGTLAATGVYYFMGYLKDVRPLSGPEAFAGLGEAWRAWLQAIGDGRGLEFLSRGDLRLYYSWTPWPFFWAMVSGFSALIVASLLTPPEDARRIAAFFDNQVRSTDGEALPQGGQKPLARERGQDLLFLDLPGWFTRERWQGFFFRYREDLVGFALAWIAVGLMVLCAWGLMQLGR
ncbi:sodium:solute symporter family protein [bacterium]|nr:sodium:solute symporter family protein [bacterium]